MKSVFITFDQANKEAVMEALDASLCHGFTLMPEIAGRGTKTGEPHLGTHAWPAMNCGVMTICEDEKVKPLLDRLHQIDVDNPLLGLRAFVWNIEQTI